VRASRRWCRSPLASTPRVTREHTRTRIQELEQRADNAKFDPATYAANWPLQLGTLGSGNHFIEVSLDEEDRVWLFLHSGSRGVGNKIAMHHIKVAQELCRKWWINLPDPDLAYLVEGTDEFWAYIRELRWAQHFALLNREEMMDRVVSSFEAWVGADVVESERINCHHNYTVQEKHFGKKVWLSRKGAIDAGKGVPGLIPGSIGTRSYVVEGKGNPLATELLAPRCGPRVRTQARSADLYLRPAREVDGGHRVVRLQGVHRRDPQRIQGHRRCHEGRRRPRGDSAHAKADHQRER